MTENKTPLSLLAKDSRRAAELLQAAICRDCKSCVSELSDLVRHTLFELSEEERFGMENRKTAHFSALHALSGAVTRAFSAAVLIPEELAASAPLCEIASAHVELAEYAEALLSGAPPRLPHTLHRAANRARGAHALLLTNCTALSHTPSLLALALALEAHRAALEEAAFALMELCFSERSAQKQDF